MLVPLVHATVYERFSTEEGLRRGCRRGSGERAVGVKSSSHSQRESSRSDLRRRHQP